MYMMGDQLHVLGVTLDHQILSAIPLVGKRCVLEWAVVQELIRSGADDVKSKALQTAGNLAFCQENRQLILQAEGFKEIMVRMADQGGVVKHETRMSAIRALAILGQLSAPPCPALPCPAASCPAIQPALRRQLKS